MLELVLAFHPKADVHEGSVIGGGTPLHVAALIGDVRMVGLLLKNGAKCGSTVSQSFDRVGLERNMMAP